MDKAERATNVLVEKVLQQLAEEWKKADEFERERMKWEVDKAKRELKQDERFMDSLGHLVAMIRPPHPRPMGLPIQSVPPPIARPPHLCQDQCHHLWRTHFEVCTTFLRVMLKMTQIDQHTCIWTSYHLQLLLTLLLYSIVLPLVYYIQYMKSVVCSVKVISECTSDHLCYS